MDRYVVITNDAFRAMVISALEGYLVPHGRRVNANEHRPVETYGTLWGFITHKPKTEELIYQITLADIDSSAYRAAESVTEKDLAIRIKSAYLDKFNPELHYLGDFHSHPWHKDYDLQEHPYVKSAQMLEQGRTIEGGRPYQFSEQDFGWVRSLRAAGRDYRIGVVVTIYQMANLIRDTSTVYLDGHSAIRFTYNGPDASEKERSFRIWIKAYVYDERDDTQKDSPVDDKDVILICPAIGKRLTGEAG